MTQELSPDASKLEQSMCELERIGIGVTRDIHPCPNCMSDDVAQSIQRLTTAPIGFLYYYKAHDGRLVIECGAIEDATVEVIATNKIKASPILQTVVAILEQYGLTVDALEDSTILLKGAWHLENS